MDISFWEFIKTDPIFYILVISYAIIITAERLLLFIRKVRGFIWEGQDRRLKNKE